jgi:hypothetical protein
MPPAGFEPVVTNESDRQWSQLVGARCKAYRTWLWEYVYNLKIKVEIKDDSKYAAVAGWLYFKLNHFSVPADEVCRCMICSQPSKCVAAEIILPLFLRMFWYLY